MHGWNQPGAPSFGSTRPDSGTAAVALACGSPRPSGSLSLFCLRRLKGITLRHVTTTRSNES